MSITYTPITDFLTKDTLPKEDPDKVILGADFDAEFQAISTAFTAAAPVVDPNFTGTATFVDIDCATIDASGNATVGGTFAVTGATTLGELTAGVSTLGNTTVGTLDTSGNATVTGTLSVTGAVTSGGSLLTTTDNVNDLIALAELGTIATLDDLSDVDDTGKVDGSVLGWNATESEWRVTEISASPSVELTASGAIAAGDTLIANTDGTVSAVVGQVQSLGTEVDWETAGAAYGFSKKSVFEDVSGNLVTLFTSPLTSRLSAIVGDVTGSSISFGSQVELTTNGTGGVALAVIPGTGKVLVIYSDTTDTDLKAVVGTVSGTSITFGTAVQVNAATTGGGNLSLAWSPDDSCFLVAFKDHNDQNTLQMATITVSGTTPTVQSTGVQLDASTTVSYVSVTYDTTNDKFLAVFQRNADIETRIVTLTGYTPSIGTRVEIDASGSRSLADVVYHPTEDKHVVLYQSNAGAAGRLATVDISTGTPVISTPIDITTESINHEYSSIEYAADVDVVIFRYTVFTGGGTGYFNSASLLSGTTFNLGSAEEMDSTTGRASLGYDSVNGRAVSLFTNSTDTYGSAVVFTPPDSNLTASNFIGFAGEAYADAATATVQLVGSVNTNQSGLTAGEKYYVQDNGTLATTATALNVSAGTAISATSIIVKG